MAPTIVTLTLNPALDVTTSAERVVHTDKVRCGEPRFDPGGGGINVARVACRLGVGACAIFPAGGPAGAEIRRLLETEGVPAIPVPIGGRSRESFVVDEAASGLQYRFVLPGPALSEQEQDAILARVEEVAAGQQAILVVSGSPPPGLPAGFFERLRSGSARRGNRLILDLPGDRIRESAGPGVFLIKPNRRELEQSAGRPLEGEADEVEAARAFIEQGLSEAVAASFGEKGAMLVTASEAIRVAAPPVETRSAVGAGDSMVAGMVVGLACGLPLAESLKLGVAAGAAALATPGTELARRSEIERLYGRSIGTPGGGDPAPACGELSR